jgi:enoyl-CoA hydratase
VVARAARPGLARIERAGKPVIAAVNGFALGAAASWPWPATCASPPDTGAPRPAGGRRSASSRAPAARSGCPAWSGRGRALDLILSGDPIPAPEALRIGLVERVVPAASLREEVEAYAAKLLSRSPTALARALEAVLSGGESAQPEAERLEAALFGLCFATDDMREGTAAFLEKRKASFPGK